jgi:hypothetical protein
MTKELSALWNPKLHYRVHKSPALDLIQSTPPIPTCLRLILMLFSITHLGLSNCMFRSVLPIKTLYEFTSPSCMIYVLPVSFSLTFIGLITVCVCPVRVTLILQIPPRKIHSVLYSHKSNYVRYFARRMCITDSRNSTAVANPMKAVKPMVDTTAETITIHVKTND